MLFFFDDEIILKIIGRENFLFLQDLEKNAKTIEEIINSSSFLIVGGAGSIGKTVCKEIFKRNPRKLYVVDINENGLVDLVRDIRSSLGYIEGDFGVFTIDVGSFIFEKFFDNYGPYDYVLNFSALKHVRSEKDPFTLMRMIEVNVLNVVKMLELSISKGVRKFFCVSTDKATNPVNMMGASKRIMELFLMKYSDKIDISTSRFANVAFSDGSLLDSFLKRVQKKQPIVIPNSVKRYFITPYESAVLCIMSVVLGENLDIFFPKNIVPIDFRSIVERFLDYIGFEPYFCYNEEEARGSMVLVSQRKWPCLISQTDTTGEKEVEEFVDINEEVDYDRFRDIAVTKISYRGQDLQQKLDYFMDSIEKVKSKKGWIKDDFVSIFQNILPEFKHMEKFKYLDEKM